jgi:subtilisin family serine protease
LVYCIPLVHEILPLTTILGGDASQAWVSAIDAAYNAGVLSVVAAGNGDENGNPLPVSSQSPANAANAITVAALTSAWKPTSFTNYGMLISFLL